MFHLRLFDDVYPPGAAVTATRPAPHSILYVFAGSAAIAGSPLTQQEAGYFRDDLSVEAGPAGATIWRWELVERTEKTLPKRLRQGNAALPHPGVGTYLRGGI